MAKIEFFSAFGRTSRAILRTAWGTRHDNTEFFANFKINICQRRKKTVDSPISRSLIPITQIQTLLVLSPLAVGFVVLFSSFIRFVYIDCDSITLCGHSVTVMRCRSSHYTRTSFSLCICFYSECYIYFVHLGDCCWCSATILRSGASAGRYNFLLSFSFFVCIADNLTEMARTIYVWIRRITFCFIFFSLLVFLFGPCVRYLISHFTRERQLEFAFIFPSRRHSIVLCLLSMEHEALGLLSHKFHRFFLARITSVSGIVDRPSEDVALEQRFRNGTIPTTGRWFYLLTRLLFFRLVFFCVLSLSCIYIAIYLIGYLHDDSTPCSGCCCVNVSLQFARALWIRLFPSSSLHTPFFVCVSRALWMFM